MKQSCGKTSRTLPRLSALALALAGLTSFPAQAFQFGSGELIGALDTTIKYVVLIVGILLILGLCTRPACVVGIGFLASVIATQPPWVETANTMYFYYQLVEVLALFVLFVFAAGQFGGLDYLANGLYRRCCPPKKQTP